MSLKCVRYPADHRQFSFRKGATLVIVSPNVTKCQPQNTLHRKHFKWKWEFHNEIGGLWFGAKRDLASTSSWVTVIRSLISINFPKSVR